jgi:hypothetical protein
MMRSSEMKKVGIGWYSKNEWFKLSTVAADADRLEKSYEEWLEAFKKGCDELLGAGIIAVKVPVHVQDLLDWCNRQGLALDSDARSQYIAEQLRNLPEDGRRKEGKESVKEALFEAIENQIRDDNPKETRLTLERLVREGLPQNEAMRMIAFALVQELNGMLKTGSPFNQARYIKALKALRKHA